MLDVRGGRDRRTLHLMDCAVDLKRKLSSRGNGGGILTLVRVAGAHADVADVSSLDYVVQGLHLGKSSLGHEDSRTRTTYSLFYRRVIVKPMA